MCDCSISALSERPPGEVLTIGGIVTDLTKRVTRRGDIMVTLNIEDVAGATAEVVVFPRAHEQYAAHCRPDAILLIKGRLDQDVRDESMKLIAMEMREPELGEDKPLEIFLAMEACTEKTVANLKDVLSSHPGATQVFLHIAKAERTTVLRLGSEFSVDTTNGLHAELKALLGPRALV
jgi:DNA polymerase-3 subunit alpha